MAAGKGLILSLDDLLEQAKQGDRAALGRLLMAHDLRLRRHIDRRLPADLRGALSTEDVLQETYIEAYRHVGSFESRGPQAFYRWLAVIADHQLADAAKALRAAKRPPPDRARQVPLDRSTSFLALVQLLDRTGSTPSRILGAKEAVQAMQVALASLPEACRQAVWMRHIEGRAVREIAAAMGRTEHAVHQLCYRGLAMLAEAMGPTSRFMTDLR